jgi:glycosyltransferase involved in cell wall biosynthesis
MIAPTPSPKISVIIPTYRRQHLVAAAVRSVLEEPIDELEVLVVDDDPQRSAEQAVAAVDDGRVRYLTMAAWSGGRPANVRNWAMRHASGDLLYFLDDDDTVVPGGLVALADALERNPNAGVAFGRLRPVGPDRRILLDYMHYFERAARVARRVRWSSWLTAGVIMFRGTLIVNSVCIIRRQLALELGGYDTDLEVYEDVDFYTRGIMRSGHVFVDWPVLCYATGSPSLIHDLGGDQSKVAASNSLAHSKFRSAHPIRYRALQAVAKVIPLGT